MNLGFNFDLGGSDPLTTPSGDEKLEKYYFYRSSVINGYSDAFIHSQILQNASEITYYISRDQKTSLELLAISKMADMY